MIRAVVFDFGNVICKFDNKIILRRISEHTGKSMGELEETVYRASGLISDYERGMVSSDDFFNQLAAMCGLRLSKEEFIRSYTDKFTPIPETYELIRSLKRKYKLGLLSNTSAWDFEYGIRTTGVFPMFDAVTVSFQVHALKPEKDIYLDVLSKLDVKPHECVYIDDIQKYVEAARGLGMYAAQYRSPLELVESLKDLDIPLSELRLNLAQPKTKSTGSRTRRKRRTRVSPGLLPQYCDYTCAHASFPPADAVGACRKEVGVYCTLLSRYNNKNGACLARAKGE